jgi:HlyD family secretion protein
MKKLLIGLLTIVLLAGVTFWTLNHGGTSAAAPKATAEPVKTSETGTPVVAKAKVVPVQSVELRYPSNGDSTRLLVQEVLVHEGDTVKQGAPLARLDTRDLQLRVEEARAALAKDKANYDKLVAGASPEEIEQARTLVAQAHAKLHEVTGNVTSQDIAAAQAQVTEAHTNLAQLQGGSNASKVEVAQATLDQVQANLQSQRDSLSGTKTAAQLRMEQAANTLSIRQANYSRIQAQGDQQATDEAMLAVKEAETALRQAQVDYEQAQKAEISGIAAAQAEVRNAQAALDGLLAGSDPGQLAAARAQVAQATANLVKLQGDQRAGSLELASAEEAAAKANLDKLSAPPHTTDLAIAQAQVQAAEVAVKRAEFDLDQATLLAPISGTVVGVNLKVGEPPSQTEPAIVLADLGTWQIETADVVEQDAVRVQQGDPVTITFDALPGFELAGKVTHVTAIGTSTPTNFNIAYKVIITPAQQDKRLRWNMTASVTIKPTTVSSQEPSQSPSPTQSQTSPSATAVRPTSVPPTAVPTTGAAPTSSATNYTEYTVQKGDILSAIAQKYGTDVKDILALNQIDNPDSLRVGQVIRIPKK